MSYSPGLYWCIMEIFEVEVEGLSVNPVKCVNPLGWCDTVMQDCIMHNALHIYIHDSYSYHNYVNNA